MTKRRVHLVFKTHLDIGFTDHAEKVRRQYHERFIPQAIETGTHFWTEDPDELKFIWTTGAWLIWDHLNSRSKHEVARLEQAIERGIIRWHGLPFTTHTELMSPALFRAGLSFSQELDQRFGKKTTAAKMTDVPGHTLGMVPLMAQAGLRFLHIGVNTASPPPEVPEVFRWRAPGGEEIVVMYQRSYGEMSFPAGMDEGLGFAHTSDNIGPQSVSQAIEAYRDIIRREGEYDLRAATLEDYGALLWQAREKFPVLELETGDSWIHGSATDPAKTARFLALQRLYDRFAGEELSASRLAFGRKLSMVAEHTCGVDIKSYLRDDKAWARPQFEAARKAKFNFAYTEASWAEQRAYLDQAVAHLGDADRKAAAAALAELAAPAPLDVSSSDPHVAIGGWSIALDPESGDIASITSPSGSTLTGRDGSLIGYRYESYDAADIHRHMDTYLRHEEGWAILDHDKPGLERCETASSQVFEPKLVGVNAAGLSLVMPELAISSYGAPSRLSIRLAALGDVLELTLVMHDKPANRMPEASFLHFMPASAVGWHLHKMGIWHRSDRYVHGGGAQLQAVSAMRADLADEAKLTIEPLDTPLVAPQSWDFMSFCKTLPDFRDGIRFNLHNNKWGTNFPMWCEGDLVARFRISV